jgi:DNA-binding NarL/FixJ family response regulator
MIIRSETRDRRRVVIQERKRLLRLGLAEILVARGGIEVLGSVANAAQLREVVDRTQPGSVVLELDAPWDVRELVTDLRRSAPGIRVIALHPGRLSDHGRLGSDALIDELAPYGGGTSAILAAIVGEPTLVPRSDRPDRRRLPSRTSLTPRECEVLRHLAAGMTAADCAAALHVSPKTVDNHKQRIFSKLGVQNQAHAVALAHRIGLLGRAPYDTAASG